MDLFCLTIGTQYYTREFIEKVLDELDRVPVRIAVGDDISNLEKLAYDLLLIGAFANAPRRIVDL